MSIASISQPPLWLVFCLTLGVIIASVELGYRWADRRQAKQKKEVEAPISAMVGATLGLLAFLLAVTFGIASDAFHDRKVAVVDEANAIRTSYLQAGLVPQPQRDTIRALLREYTDARLRWAGIPDIPSTRSAPTLQLLLWQQTAIVGQHSSDVIALFVESMNNTFDQWARRQLLRERSHIPNGYIIALLTLAVLAHSAMGYHGGVTGTARSPVMLMVAIAFSLVILLIFDLDRPNEGLINISQQAMLDLRTWMHHTRL